VYVELKEQRAAEKDSKDAPQGERQTQTGFLGKKRPQRGAETETETEIQTQTQTQTQTQAQRGAGLQVERGGGGGGGGMVCNDGDGAGERHTYSKSPEYSDWIQ
jgi:hypothetical protein